MTRQERLERLVAQGHNGVNSLAAAAKANIRDHRMTLVLWRATTRAYLRDRSMQDAQSISDDAILEAVRADGGGGTIEEAAARFSAASGWSPIRLERLLKGPVPMAALLLRGLARARPRRQELAQEWVRRVHHTGHDDWGGGRHFDIITITDSDSTVRSKEDPATFVAFLKHFSLVSYYRVDKRRVEYHLEDDRGGAGVEGGATRLYSRYAFGGRGGEFSDVLFTPRGVLYTFDDRTGIAFEVVSRASLGRGRGEERKLSRWEDHHHRELRNRGAFNLIPRVILADGDGSSTNGFKCEWSSMQGEHMVVGSHGYEIWGDGVEPVRGTGMRNVQWVKRIDVETGQVLHEDFSHVYNALQDSVGVVPGGYLTHEAAAWSETRQRWFFMPRRISRDKPWHPQEDEVRGCNLLLSCNAEGGDVKVVEIQTVVDPRRGYSAMRFVPGSGDAHLIATKTIEMGSDDVHSYVTVIDVDGEVLLPETYVGPVKYEGLEVLMMPARGGGASRTIQ